MTHQSFPFLRSLSFGRAKQYYLPRPSGTLAKEDWPDPNLVVSARFCFNTKMNKDFRKWHDKKTQVDEIVKRPFFHDGKIWFCHLGINVGFEEDGLGKDFLRPVIIIRKFNKEIFWAIPLTRTNKKTKYYFSFSFDKNVISTAILSQIRLVDARRLSYKIGDISSKDFKELKEKLKALLP